MTTSVDRATQPGPFSLLGPTRPSTPIVIAVPHAGRDYPAELLAMARGGGDRLALLEDRFADRICDRALAQGATVIVAHRARAWIDLNRDPREIDPAMVVPPPDRERLVDSAKLRAGLGLLPRRVASTGELWNRKLTMAEVADRIGEVHEPYHHAIADRLAQARKRFGQAMLIDCHSMPPLHDEPGRKAPRIILGDRFGRAADPALVDLAARIVADAGLSVARNAPYAGGYTLDRHARPHRGVHALQIEFDRSLYLEGNPGELSEGLDRCGALLAALSAGLAATLSGDPAIPIAAE